MNHYCLVCNRRDTDKCHIKSKGSGGSDDDINILRMCRMHHSEQHSIGWHRFSLKYPKVLLELEARRYYFDPHNKLRKDK